MAAGRSVGPSRRRGRPPRSDGQATASRLLDAAAVVCAERGFDGSTLAEIAARADVTPTAIYNHFDSREALLYAAAVRGLDEMTAVAQQGGSGQVTLPAIAAAYLRPEMRQTRRLIAELHLASGRDERLAALLAEWHATYVDVITNALRDVDPAPEVTAKTLFLVLLGLCHLDDLPAVEAPHAAVVARVEQLVAALAPAAPVEVRPRS